MTYAADLLATALDEPSSRFQKDLVDSGACVSAYFGWYTQMNTGPITLELRGAARQGRRVHPRGADGARQDARRRLRQRRGAGERGQSLEVDTAREREKPSEFAHSITFWWTSAGLDYYYGYVDDVHKATRAQMVKFLDDYVTGQAVRARRDGLARDAERQGGTDQSTLRTGGGGAQMSRLMTTATILGLLAATAMPARAAEEAKAADPAPVTDGDVTSSWLHGMQIIVKRVPHADFVAAQLYVRGGARNWSAADAGVERLALAAALGGGTETLPKEAFTRRLAKLGTQLWTTSNEDFSVINLKSLRSRYDESFPLLADAFLHPALPPSEIELWRQRQLAELKHEEDVPDLRLNVLAHKLVYKGHPYEQRAVGTLETVTALDAARLRAHLGKLRESGRLLLVVVGDVEAAHVLEAVRAAFGTLPRGHWKDAPLPKLTESAPHLAVVEKKLPTNYILSYFLGPGWRDPDFAAALVAMDALHYREFLEVRTKRNLSYAPGAGFNRRSAVPWGLLYVTAVDPTGTMRVMLDEARRMATEPMPEDELAGNKSTFLSQFLMGEETTDGQAGLLGAMQIYTGDWRNARKLPDRIRAVTAADVQAFAKKYIHNLQTAYVGDPTKLDKTLFDSL